MGEHRLNIFNTIYDDYSYYYYVWFYYDGSSVIVDNPASSHICSEEEMLTEKIYPIIYNGVANICEKYFIPKGVGAVSWY